MCVRINKDDCLFQNTVFELKNQYAQDNGRYDYLEDVRRIERIKSKNMVTRGFAIFLTNDYLLEIRWSLCR